MLGGAYLVRAAYAARACFPILTEPKARGFIIEQLRFKAKQLASFTATAPKALLFILGGGVT